MSLNTKTTIKLENYVNMTIISDEFGRRAVDPAYYERSSRGVNWIAGGAHSNRSTPLAATAATLATTVSDSSQADLPPKTNLRVESFSNTRLTCKKFARHAVGADNNESLSHGITCPGEPVGGARADGLTPLAAAAAVMARRPAINIPPSACICCRPKVRVICMSCNFSMVGRREIACPQHHNIKYLNDLKVCPNCRAIKNFLREEEI